MEAMKILITGGAGFIGSHLVDAYCGLGYEVVVLDDLSCGKKEFVNSNAEFIEGDITNKTVVEDLFNRYGRFDAVNHLAAQKSVTASVEDPSSDAKINIVGSLNVFQAAYRSGTGRIIFSSTGGAIYGPDSSLPCPETASAQPLAPYGIAKLSVERYLDYYHSLGMSTQVLRYANVYGPRQDPHGEAGVVAIFCQQIAGGQPLTIFGDGLQTRDFVFVDDVVRANLAVTDSSKSGLKSGLWNIGTGQETSVVDIAGRLNELAGSMGLSVQPVLYAPARVGELRRSAIDPTLAGQELNWQASASVNEGLKKTLRSFV